MMAAEGYLLNELAPEERDAFEEHYFGCCECATDLQAAAAFLETAKQEMSRLELASSAAARKLPALRKQPLRWWRPAWALASLAVLLAVSIGFNLSQRERLQHSVAALESPRLLPNLALMTSNARGAGTPVVRISPGHPFLLYVDVPASSRYHSYAAALYSPSGAQEWSLGIPPEATRDTLPIQSAPPRHGSGVYVLKISGVAADGGSPELIEQLPFEIQEQK